MYSLSQYFEAIADRPEFLVKRYDGLICINYVVALPDSFEGIRENCRGITFNESGELISLPFHKFFNINEKEHLKFNLLSHLKATIYEKIDGTLIHCFLHKEEVKCATRFGYTTDQAKFAQKILYSKPKLLSLVKQSILNGYTPLFELIGPKYRIVIDAKDNQLVYLTSRNRKNYTYLEESQYSEFVNIAQTIDWPFNNILEILKDKENMEGVVCRLEDGRWVKAKCKWYIDRHRCVDLRNASLNKLYQLVYDGLMDDIIAFAYNLDKIYFENIYKDAQLKFLNVLNSYSIMLGDYLNKIGIVEDKKEHRKKLASIINQNNPNNMSILMKLYDGQNADKLIQKEIVAGIKG